MNMLTWMNRPVWSMFREMEDLDSPLGRLLTRESRRNEGDIRSDWTPAVDITENDEAYEVKAELPALSREDISVKVENRMLTISGERKSETEHKDDKVHRVERSFGRFVRSFGVPDNADGDNVSARYQDGVLTVTLPKVPEARPSTVDVRIG